MSAAPLLRFARVVVSCLLGATPSAGARHSVAIEFAGVEEHGVAASAVRPRKPLVLRSYQRECVERAIEKNTIVVLPTNAGKTLVAVKVIDHFRRARPNLPVVFTVPTKVLVGQQAAYIRAHSAAEETVAEMHGTDWKEEWRASTVLVGTPEVFRQAFEKGFLQPGQISLLVFDECHNAKGRSSMARIMSECIASVSEDERPHILAITASFAASASAVRGDLEQAKIDLELLFHANMICPDVRIDEASVDAGVPEKWHRVQTPVENLEARFGDSVDAYFLAMVKDVDPEGKIDVNSKTSGPMKHVLGQLGMKGLTYAMRYSSMQLLLSQPQALAQRGDPAAKVDAAELSKALPYLREKLQNYGGTMPKELRAAPAVSKKAEELFRLLRDLKVKGKGLVFVNQIILTAPLAYMIEQNLTDCRAVAFYGGMPRKKQDDAMLGFGTGVVSVLVATDALLEGIDVPDCQWVVRFDEFRTTRSHIQGSGRARSLTAQVYYFDNDPDMEQKRAGLMLSVARDAAVRATDGHRQNMAALQEQRRATANGVHPYEEPDARPVHFGNGLELVYAWAQQVCKASFSAERLIEWAPREDGVELLRIVIPGPDGWLRIERAEVDMFWGTVGLEDALDSSALRQLSGKEKERRRALFVAAVRLRKEGWLDEKNTPMERPLLQAQSTFKECDNSTQPRKLTIGKTYPRSLPHGSDGNFVSALNEWAQVLSTEPNQVVRYSDEMTADGWISNVEISPLQATVKGESHFPRKIQARQDVARRALEILSELGS